MADNSEVSDKEKQNSAQDEKEKDTKVASPTPVKAKSPSPAPAKVKSPVPSKPGSAKSSNSSKGGKKDKGKAKGKGKKKEEEPAPMTPAPAESGDALPEGAFPIFLSSKTQEIFDTKVDEDVTEESPFKEILKEDIIQDLFNRAAISDFHPFKPTVQNYQGESILVMYDPDFKWGQNFVIATTEEAKEILMKGDAEDQAAAEAAAAEKAAEEAIVYKYIPPTPKEWISLGSEKEIAEEALQPTRKKVKFTAIRKRREFGRYVVLSDRNVADAKDAYQECTSYEDSTYSITRLELNKATQAVPVIQDNCSQTNWKYPRNACTQYEAREMREEDIKAHVDSKALAEFLEASIPRFELALQQNNIMNVFYDDWQKLGDEDSSFGSKADNHLKEYQSFTDLQFSKDKSVTCIDWHPTIKGVVAVSVTEKMTFDERIEQAHKCIMTPSLILVWSFTDPIHPQLLLEAPDDIMCFKFMPADPNIVCGGCINGQVVLWDISKHTDRLKAPRGGKKTNTTSLPGFEDENVLETPIVRYCAVSSIENSHRAPITDIKWVPDHLELNRMGIPHENTSGTNVQLMTCAIDFSVLVWDTRPPKTAQSMLASIEKKKEAVNNPMGIPDTFKHLDLSWKPHLRIMLYKSEPGGDHSPSKFSISEFQGDKAAKDKEKGADTGSNSTAGSGGGYGGFTSGAGGRSGSAKKTLSHVKTHFYVGTEDGELVYVDWMPQKDQDTGKVQTPKPDYYHTCHDGAIQTLQRSPFFRDIILVVGGWTFSIWKESVTTGPILRSNASNKKLTAGHWSPTRPGIFFITREDGSVDTWDLLDRTHEPSMNQSVTPSPITCIFPYQVTNKQHLLAIGDSAGTLHILEIPWSLRQPTPNELSGVSNYFDREIQRRTFVVSRWDFREKEKMDHEQEAKRKAGIAPAHHITDDEILYRMKQEYDAYCSEEASFLRELGLKETEEEPLPVVD